MSNRPMPAPDALPAQPLPATARRAASAQRREAARRRALQRRRPRVSRLLAWLLAAWLGQSGFALAQGAPGALPMGGQVMVGSGQLQLSPNLLVIQQNSNRLGMDWQSFNIGSSATVEFRQPGASSIALNRVLGNSSTEIYGQLKANGQVFLTNPNGVLFAPGSKVDVGGLVASTLDLSQQDFAEGRYVFNAGAVHGAVVNQGQLNASAGGYLALFGNQVTNQGDISVNAGSVVLASGRAATVSISGSGLISAVVTPGTLQGGVDNSGRIVADGGVVTLTAKSAQDIAASLVNNSGIVRANTLVEKAGEIWITGDNVTSRGTTLADAPNGGDAGRITIKGDMGRGTLDVGGRISASSQGGRGGQVETSAARVSVAADTRVDTRGTGGSYGNWTIDPTDFAVAAGAGPLTASGIGADTLATNLGSTGVTLATSAAANGSDFGDIHVNADVSWSANTTLTLQAHRDINFNASVTASGAAAGVVLTPGASGSVNFGTTDVLKPKLTLGGVNAALTIGGQAYTLVRDMAGVQAMQAGLAGRYALVVDVDASATSGYVPVGAETNATLSTTGVFTGTLEGLGHSIANLTISRPAGNSTGLFANTNNATLRNFELVAISVTGSQYVGAVAGYTLGTTTLTNVRSAGTVAAVADASTSVWAGGLVGLSQSTAIQRSVANTAVSSTTSATTAYAGGMVGQMTTGTLTSVSAGGAVTSSFTGANDASHYAGGLVGQYAGGNINTASATGNVTGGRESGGLIGRLQPATTATLTQSTTSGNVSGTGDAGGLVGYASGTGSITNSSATGTVTSSATTAYSVGGLAGYYALSGGITATTSAGNVTGGAHTGGAIGYYSTTTTLSGVSTTATSVTGNTWVGGVVGYVNSAATLSGLTGTASVTATGPNGGAGGLAGRANGSVTGSSASGNVTGVDDVGGLVGYAVGTGTMSNVGASGSVTSTSTSGAAYAGGLVGRYALTGAISGTVTATGVVSGGSSAGGFVGYWNSTAAISGLTRGSASVTGRDYVGGVVGYSEASSISGLSSSANVTATGTAVGAAGGVAGRTTGSIATSSATGNVSGLYTVGGLVGLAEGTGALSDGSATGNVTSSTTAAWIGGLVGQYALSGSITGTISATGVVSGGSSAGGVVGYYNSTAPISGLTRGSASVTGQDWVGGLIGYSNASSITGASSAANVTATGSGYAAGGLVGRTGGSITNSSASGNVAAVGDAGGLIGRAEGTGALTDVSATGSVTSTGTSGIRVGGLAGYVTSGAILRGTASGAVSGGTETGGLVGSYNDAGGIQNSSTAVTSTVSGLRYVGGLVGNANGTGSYTDVTARGAVTGGNYTGGLLGSLSGAGAVTTALAIGKVTSGGSYAGGLIGQWSSGSSITDSRAEGNVVSSNQSGYVGGLVGYAIHYSTTAHITNSSAAGNVSGGYYAGGLVGLAYDTHIVRGTATGSVTTSSDNSTFAGGLVGYFADYYYAGHQISNSSATGRVFSDSPNSYAGGLVGYFTSGSISASTASGSVTARDSINPGSNSHYIGGLVGVFSGVGIADSAASGDVGSGYYAGGLAGNYNGSAPLTNSSATGNVTGTQYVGGLVGYLQNTGITNGFASGQVSATGTGDTGGLVGYAYVYAAGNLAGINDSRATGNVSGGNRAGGLVGYLQDYNSTAGTVSGITNSRASGNVSANSIAGGLVGYFVGGYANVTTGISNSSASGNVEANLQAGGLMGSHNSYGGVRDSFATGNVLGLGNNSDKSLGGLVGVFQTSNTTAGAGLLTRSYATGNVSLASGVTFSSGTDVYAGGLVGTLTGSSTSATALTDSYAAGAVNIAAASLGRLNAGGLVGQANGAIARTFATGAVSATGGSTRTVGGLAALRNTSSTVSSSFWATDTSGQATSNGGTASTLAGLRDDATFTGWDLATASGSTAVWRIYDTLTTPLLRNLLTPLTLSLADVSKVYDGTTSLGSAPISVNGTAVSNPERILVAGVTGNVGTHALTTANLYSVQNGYDLGITGTANLTITGRQLTLTGLAANKVYDGNTSASLASNPQFGGLVAGDDLVFQPGSGFGLQFATRTAGTGKTVNIAGGYSFADGAVGRAANYILPSASTTTADITPAPLTAGSFTATNRVYDGTTTVAVSAASSTLSGVVSGDSVNVDLSLVTSGTVANKNVGTGKAVTVSGVAIGGADAANYALTALDSVSVNITPKTITVNGINATDRQYNQGINVGLTTGSVSLAGVVSGDDVEPRLSGMTGTVADKNVGNAKAVTVTGAALRGIDAGNYTAQPGAVSVNITPYQLTLYLSTTSQTNRVYDGTTNAAVTFPNYYWYSSDDLVVSTTSVGYADKSVAYNSSGGVISKTITASGISISGADAGNYALQNTTATTSGTISPKPLTVSGVAAVNRVYDGTRDVTVNVNGATVDTTAVVSGDVVSVATPGTSSVVGQTANKDVGTAKAVTVPGLTLTGTDAGNYTITSSTGGVTVNITRKPLTAVYTAVNKVYDSNTYATMNVTSSDIVSGDSINFYIDQSYCGVNACGYALFTEAGRAANGSYVQSRHVGTAKPVVITYNQLVGTDANNYTLLNPTGAATGATTTADITPKPVTLAYIGVSKVYDGTTDATVTVSLGGGSNSVYSGDSVTTTQTAVYTGATAKDVGTSKPISVTGIVLSGTHAGNYTVGNTTTTTTGNLTAKPITISGITATDREYDGTTTVAVTAGTVTSAGFVSGDTVAVSLPSGGLSTGTIANKNVGTAKPVTVTGLTLSGTDANNYSIDAAGSGITVNITSRALTPTYSGVNRVYNGGVTVGVTPTTTGIATGDTVTFGQQAIFTGVNARDVGTAKPISVTSITLGGASAANYSLASTTASTTADITPKTVTATYTGASRVYNGVADVSASVIGSSLQFIAGDSVGLAQTASFTGDGSAGTSKPVSITAIALTGAQAANYSLVNTAASTTASITPRPLGVTGITASNRVYDGTITVAVNVANASVDTSAKVPGDDVVAALPPSGITTGSMSDRHAGNNKPVSITGVTLSGAQAANYSLIGATGLVVSIAPKSLTAAYSGVNKVYDGNADAVVSVSSSDIFSVDSASLSFNAQGLFAAGKNVGTGKAVDVISAFLSGASANNYTLANPTGTTSADITPRALTANYGGGSRVYDGTVSAPVSVSFANRIAGDNVGASQTAEFTGATARNVGNGKAISVSNIALTGSDSGNYTLNNTTDTTTGSITPKPITVSGLTNVLATDRVYDATRDVTVTVPVGVTLVPNSSDIVAGDTVTIDVPITGVTTGTVASKNVGNNKTVTVSGLTLSGTDAANYSIAGTAGITVNITPKSMTAIYNGVNKVYDGSASVSVTGASADLITGDSLLIRGSGTVTGTGAKDVGTGKPVNVTSADLSGADAVNYALLNPTGTATVDITQRLVTPSYQGGSRVYDGSTTAPVANTVANFVAGDNISLTETAVFAGANARNAGLDKTIQVSGIALAGTDAGNYSLASVSATASGTITPKPITLTGLTGVAATDRVYDGTRTVDVIVSSTGTIEVNPADIVAGDVVSVLAPTAGATTGTMLTKNAGTNKPLVVNGLDLTGTDAGNYSVSATNGVTVNIAAKSLTAVYTGVDKVYDGTAAATVVGSSADQVAGDSLAITGRGVFSAGKHAGTGKTINVTAGSLAGTDAANYALLNNTATATADITPKAATVSYLGGTRVYDGTVDAPVSGTLGGLIAGDAVALTQTAVFSGGTAAKNVGSAKAVDVSGIALGGSDGGNYSLGTTTASTTASVIPRPLGILGLTGVSATDRVYDGTTTVAVTVATTGTVTPNPSDLIAGDVVTITAPPTGQTTGTMADKNVGSNKPVAVAGLALGGADAGNYSVASTSGVAVNIAAKSLTAVYTAAHRVYDGTVAATATGSSGDIVAGDSVLISATGVFTGAAARNVGTAKPVDVQGAALSSADAGNYTLANPTGSATADITPRPVIAAYAGGTRVYDGTTAAPVSSSATGFITGDVVTVSETASFSGTGAKNVGSGKPVLVSGITLSGADATNYALVSTTASTAGDITARPLNVTGLSGITAVDRVYDGTVAVQVNVSGTLGSASGDLIAGDDVTVNVPGSGVGGGSMLDKNAGLNKAVALNGLSLSGADAGNYAIAGTAGLTVNIAPKTLTASYAGTNKVYDGTVAASILGNSGGIVAGDTVLISATGVFTGTGARNVGTAKPIDVQAATLSGADATNYALVAATGTTTADITPRPVTNTYIGASRVYDGTTAAPVSGTATGVIAGDVVTVSETANFSGTGARNVGSGKPVLVSGITLSGTDASNYALLSTTASTTGGITPRPLNVTGLSGITAVDRVYDGTVAVQINVSGTLGSASGDQLAGDDVAVNVPGSGLGGGTMADKSAAQNKAVALIGLSLSGADAGNYVIAGTAGLTVNIAPRPVVLLGLSAIHRTYDASTVVAIDSSAGSLSSAVTGSSSGKLAGDDLILQTAGVTGSMADKHAGSGKAVTVSGLTLSGADAGNYTGGTGAGTTLTVDIAPRTLAAAATAADKVYDGSTGATVTLRDDRIAGDTLTITAAAANFADKSVGGNKAVTASGLSLTGADSGDYLLASNTAASTASITPRTLTASATAADKVYDGSTTASYALLDDRVSGDALALSATAAAFADKRAGSGKPVLVSGLQLTGADAGNYLLGSTEATASASITPRPVQLTATVAARVYDGSTVASALVDASNLVAGDALTLANTAARFDNKDAGDGKAVTVSGITLAGADAGNYALAGDTTSTTASILRKPITVTGNTLSKMYGESVNLTGAEFTTLGLVAGESIGLVTLASSGMAPAAAVAGSPYAVNASDARGGSFNPANYALTYASGALVITPRPLTIAANSVVRSTDEPNPNPFGFSTSVGSLVNGDSVVSVVLNAPTGSGTAPGGSIYELTPSGAVFGAGQASNYAVNYSNGLLVVLPKPPRVDDADANAGQGGGQGFAVQVEQAELDRAFEALERSASVVAQSDPDAARGTAAALRTAEATADEISVALAGDSRRITLQALLRLPLISFDPSLRRLIFGGAKPPSSTAP